MKKTILIGLLSCAVLFFAAAYAWRTPRLVQSAPPSQSPWNSHAIEGTLAGVQVREVNPSHAAVVFLYDLDNRTSSDFHLGPGPDAVIMKRLKPDGSLSSDTRARLVSAAFVPTNNRTRVALEMTDSFSWPARQAASADQSFRDFVAREASGLDGFVVFDQTSRYEIELPVNLTGVRPTLQQPARPSD
ncbi:MAG: hypothetical protein ACRD4R_14405 [Candidatus Acidiferrales bacterium]